VNIFTEERKQAPGKETCCVGSALFMGPNIKLVCSNLKKTVTVGSVNTIPRNGDFGSVL
jgi:hypothetical protein